VTADARSRAPARTRTVLLVCHANTCRSVMAHVLLERMLAEREAPPVRIRSGGIAAHARDGMIPSLDARLVLREVGIHLGEADLTSTDLRRHRHLIAEADLILTMTGDQREAVLALPEARGRRVFTLREMAGEAGDIADPFGNGEERYRATRDEIQHCLARGLDRILGALGP
jgi:protein-tyrosine-phosphatase